MINQLGSIEFSPQYLSDKTVGHWAIERDPDKEPRMYVDDVMLGLIGLEERVSPEETYRAFVAGIDENYLESVFEAERLNTNGIHAEAQYPWHYPDGRTVLIRCEGTRNFEYKNGIRTEGRHRDITELIHLQKEPVVISVLASDFECVNYVIFMENKMDDITIPYRTSERIKALIPAWEKEISFHNRLKLLIDHVGYPDDINKFYAMTRRDVIISHLETESAYFVNARAVVENGEIEYFQLKFVADRDEHGNLIGMIVGIHSIDAEMRQELSLREQVEQLVEAQTKELKQKNSNLARVNERIISMVGDIVESRDEESGGHISRVTYLSRILGFQVMKDLPEYNLTIRDVSLIARMSPLHDVGKIKIPDSILLKPGKLTPEEFEIMKTHCDKGCDILRVMSDNWDQELYRLSLDICRYHHEKWDGKGYPCGLKGDEIPISAQIVSVADTYDALVSERCYKKAFSHDEAYRMIMDGQCGKYSDKLLACFTKCRSAFTQSAAYSNASNGIFDGGEDFVFSGEENISDAVPLIEAISESMPGGFFIYQADDDEKMIYFNDIMVDYFGCSSREEFKEYIGNSFKGLVHPDDYEITEREIFNQIKSSDTHLDHVVYRIIRKDGEIRWLDDYGRMIKSADMGDVFFVFTTDFTETFLRRNAGSIYTSGSDSAADETTKAVLRDLKILLVDDSDLSRELNREILETEGAIVVEADNGLKAVNAIKESMDYDLILMDLVMPVMSGVSAIREINKLLDAAGKQCTIICLTAEGTDMQIKEALAAGAFDCLYKPLKIDELSGHIVESIRKTSLEMKQRLADTIRLANTDALTNVYSIAAFTDKIAELTAEMAEKRNIEFGVVVCDCDKLKLINDTYGHDVGDRYIINTSNALCSVFGNSPVFRVGGDEFVVIVRKNDYRNIDKLMKDLENKSAVITCLSDIENGNAAFSSGMAVYDWFVDESVGAVIKRADTEMYKVKEQKNQDQSL